MLRCVPDKMQVCRGKRKRYLVIFPRFYRLPFVHPFQSSCYIFLYIDVSASPLPQAKGGEETVLAGLFAYFSNLICVFSPVLLQSHFALSFSLID